MVAVVGDQHREAAGRLAAPRRRDERVGLQSRRDVGDELCIEGGTALDAAYEFESRVKRLGPQRIDGQRRRLGDDAHRDK